MMGGMLSRFLFLAGLLSLLGTGCRNDEGAVKLTVTYSGFKPGCIRVGVKDAQGLGEARTLEVAGKGEATGGSVTLAAYRESGWSTSLTVTAEAFEAECAGTPVATTTETVTVNKGQTAEHELALKASDMDQDGYVSRTNGGTDCDDSRAPVHPGARELCNDRDDNCDGVRDEGFDVGALCDGPGGCVGTRACAADGTGMCTAPTAVTLYADTDKDSHGAPGSAVTSCEPTRAGYVTSSDDCDDTRANVYAGAPELCDSLDNDCDGTVDDGFGVGNNCDPGQGCSGKRACETDGGTRCDFVTPPSTWFPDEDLDQHGKADAGVVTCAPDAGYIVQAGDCNDGNPFVNVDARELCDGEDNNCNGSSDESGVCPAGGAKWVDNSPSDYNALRSVAMWGDGGVWVAGPSNELRVRGPGASTFTSYDGQCSGTWNGIWVHPQNGYVVAGGDNGAIGLHEAAINSCLYSGADAANTDVRGVVGVPVGSGSFDTFFVGFDKLDPMGGRALRWTGLGTSFTNITLPGLLWDVHGISREVLFAVGGYDTPSTPDVGARIYRFKPDTSTWTDEGVQNVSGVVDDRLRGVWVVNPKLAYAVGESGSILMWNGTAWSPMTSPSSTENFTSVLAFGKNAVYVSTSNGKVYRYNGTAWSAMPGLAAVAGDSLNDLAGLGPDDIWVVGDRGWRLHWPR